MGPEQEGQNSTIPRLWERRLFEGRWKVFAPCHPRAQDGWVFEHRLVMELKVGARIPSDVQVHHRDENPANNALENLVLCPDESMHLKIHDMLRQSNARGQEVAEQFCRDYQQDVEEDLEAALKDSFTAKGRTAALRRGKGEVVALLSALPQDVQQAILKLGAPAISSRASATVRAFPRQVVPWTTDEEALLRYLAKRCNEDQIALILKRPPAVIAGKLDALPGARSHKSS
jgi:hypothetical protein